MKQETKETPLERRVRTGHIQRRDIQRRLAELAFGRANDCVRLVLEEDPDVDALDLSLLSEVKRNDKGTVEIRLIDRLQALEALSGMVGSEEGEMKAFLQALRGGEDGGGPCRPSRKSFCPGGCRIRLTTRKRPSSATGRCVPARPAPWG